MARLTGPTFGTPGDSTRRTTTAELPLGSIAYGPGTEWVYVKAGAAIAQYAACIFQGSTLGFDDVRECGAVTNFIVGVADAAFASGDYGFIQTKGVAKAKVHASDTALLPVGGSTDAGVLLTVAETVPAGGKSIVPLVTGVAAGSNVYLG